MKNQTWAIFLLLLVSCSPVKPLSPQTSLPKETIVVPTLPAPTLVTPSPTLPPTTTPSPIPVISPLLEDNNLYQALSMMPQDTNYVEFTNWALIKKNEGFEDISSTDNMSRKIKFFDIIFNKYHMPSFYGMRRLRDHASLWGWDSTDLQWEARSSIISPPVYILKFRNGFNFEPVIASLEKHGFEKTSNHGIPIYAKELDTSLDFIRTTELSIFNTAILENENMLVLSIDHDAVIRIIDTFQKESPSVVAKKAVQELILSLDDPIGAFISGNPCSLLSSQALLQRLATAPLADIKQVRLQLDSRPALQNYEALGIGYHVENSDGLGKIVLQFSDPENALKDMAIRQELAQNSMTSGKEPLPYKEMFFTLAEKAKLEGNQIVMNVTPVDRRVSRIFLMVQRLDMNFATCP